MEAHEAAMDVHLAQQAMEAALAAGATQDEAISAGHAVMEAATAAQGSAHMLDCTETHQGQLTANQRTNQKAEA